MAEHTLVAELDTPAAAARSAKELTTFLAKVAKELDKAPDTITPAAVAFGKKYGVKWSEPLSWGDGKLAGDLPEVSTVGDAVVIFHDNIAGGFGPDLQRVLAKAGAKVRASAHAPVGFGEVPIVPATRAAVEKLAAWFEQRLGNEPLAAWSAPPWSRRRLAFGTAADFVFVMDDRACRFTVPSPPSELAALERFVAKLGGTLRPASKADEKKLAGAEQAAAPKAVAAKPVAAKPTAISTKAPAITRVDGPRHDAMFSTGASLYALVGDGIMKDGDRLRGRAFDKTATSMFVDGDEVWVAGARLWRNGTPLAMPAGVDPDFWGKELKGVAKDASGVVWAGSQWVVSVRGGKVVAETGFGKDARIKAVVATELGVLLLTFVGTAFLARDGKATKLPIRGKGHLSAACVTSRGTLIVVGSGAKWSAEIYRSEDRGATFKAVKVASLVPLLSVAEFPDGRLVAGGNGVLIYSVDDGKTWKRLDLPEGAFGFKILCAHGDSVIAGNDNLSIR